jgi:hypothetical protein
MRQTSNFFAHAQHTTCTHVQSSNLPLCTQTSNRMKQELYESTDLIFLCFYFNDRTSFNQITEKHIPFIRDVFGDVPLRVLSFRKNEEQHDSFVEDEEVAMMTKRIRAKEPFVFLEENRATYELIGELRCVCALFVCLPVPVRVSL